MSTHVPMRRSRSCELLPTGESTATGTYNRKPKRFIPKGAPVASLICVKLTFLVSVMGTLCHFNFAGRPTFFKHATYGASKLEPRAR